MTQKLTEPEIVAVLQEHTPDAYREYIAQRREVERMGKGTLVHPVPASERHYCPVPAGKKLRQGALWFCDECGTRWAWVHLSGGLSFFGGKRGWVNTKTLRSPSGLCGVESLDLENGSAWLGNWAHADEYR